MIGPSLNSKFCSQIVDFLKSARNNVVRAINHTIVYSYYEIGRMIVEEERNGKERAEYGKQVIKELSKALTKEFGKGYSERNIEQIRQFYSTYSIPQTSSAELNSDAPSQKLEAEKPQTMSALFSLSWSHRNLP
jgi:hypothetical protein